MKQNKQMRVDGLWGQATATANRSFDDLSDLNKLLVLILRDFARGKRLKVKQALDTAKDKAAENKMNNQIIKREARPTLQANQAKFARMLIEWAVVPDKLEDFDECMADTSKGCVSRQEECLKQNYYCITSGWEYEEGVTQIRCFL